MKDYIVRATAANGQVRAFAATTRGVVETARKDHNTSPIATVALGRLLTGAAMMGIMMKNDSDILTVQIKGNGPIGAMTVTAEPNGHVKGFVANPEVMLPLKNGHMDIAGAVGIGVLSVIKDIGLREPYVGDTILITSEIADDLTYYFATSEQVPSSVGLGVLMNKDTKSEIFQDPALVYGKNLLCLNDGWYGEKLVHQQAVGRLGILFCRLACQCGHDQRGRVKISHIVLENDCRTIPALL